MSFLRSIIADARPRKYSPESHTRQQVTPLWQTGGLNQGVSESTVKSPDSQNPTNHINASFPKQKSASDEIVADVSVVKENIPINLDNHERGSDQLDNAQKIQSSMNIQPAEQNLQEITINPADIDQNPEPSNTLTEAQDAQYQPFDVEPTESEQTNSDGRSASETEEQLKLSDVLETKPVKMAEELIDHNEYTEVVVSPEIETDGKSEGVSDPEMTHKLKQVKKRNPIFDNSKSRKHVEDVLLKDGTTNQVSKHEGNSYSQSIIKKATIISGKLKHAVTKQDSSKSHLNFHETPPTVAANVFQTDSTYKAFEPSQSRTSHASTEKKHEIPSVQIGQIDVIIDMPAKPVSKLAATSSSNDLASRHYLRRL